MLRPMGIGVDRDENSFGSFGSFGSSGFRFAEPEELRIVRVVERERGILLQRGVRMADFVDARDQLAKTVGLVPVARLDLIFLGIEILLGSLSYRHVFTEFEAAVDPVIGG